MSKQQMSWLIEDKYVYCLREIAAEQSGRVGADRNIGKLVNEIIKDYLSNYRRTNLLNKDLSLNQIHDKIWTANMRKIDL